MINSSKQSEAANSPASFALPGAGVSPIDPRAGTYRTERFRNTVGAEWLGEYSWCATDAATYRGSWHQSQWGYGSTEAQAIADYERINAWRRECQI